MTNYARMYRFGITPWERYGSVAAASITALLDREETERSAPSAVRSTSAAAAASTPRARAEGVGGRGHRLRAGRDRGGSTKSRSVAGSATSSAT